MLGEGTMVAAFSEDHVVRLTGLSKAQLRYWDRTGFFAPSLSDENRRVAFSRIYSFLDVVALRTLGVLRRQYNVPLQHLRQVAEKLKHLESRLWTSTTLYVLNRRVLFVNPETGSTEDVLNGQYALGIPLHTILKDTERDIEKLHERAPGDIGRVTRSRNLQQNAWVIAGTRISTASVRRLHEDGYSVEQIVAEFPDLTERDVEIALEHEKKIKTAA